ncbi:hypothetical protein [Curtobacterium citreum]|uniref:Ig-like domain-containing protein n=1 Tax=Curtobacterium citreum TaxID=2036 RepID=A0ABT2HKD1_9MICO|nr:hypothetical protein [Curtobacterium citreum]MCS6523734.1 hypothetical protein [Curtobacterium citreum]TQJ26474.1 hypothetical protein FB462_0308 [Curtobacterium citreum]
MKQPIRRAALALAGAATLATVAVPTSAFAWGDPAPASEPVAITTVSGAVKTGPLEWTTHDRVPEITATSTVAGHYTMSFGGRDICSGEVEAGGTITCTADAASVGGGIAWIKVDGAAGTERAAVRLEFLAHAYVPEGTAVQRGPEAELSVQAQPDGALWVSLPNGEERWLTGDAGGHYSAVLAGLHAGDQVFVKQTVGPHSSWGGDWVTIPVTAA